MYIWLVLQIKSILCGLGAHHHISHDCIVSVFFGNSWDSICVNNWIIKFGFEQLFEASVQP